MQCYCEDTLNTTQAMDQSNTCDGLGKRHCV